MPVPFRRTSLIAAVVTAAAICAPDASSGPGTKPPVVTKVQVGGNEKVKTYIIRREIPFFPGDPLDPQKLREARSRISQVPGVDYSEIRIIENDADSTRALLAIVTEKSALDGYPVVKRGSQDRMSFGVRAVQRNFRGRSESLSCSLLFRANTVVTAAWENPWLGSGQSRIGLGLRAFYKDYEYVYDDVGGAFKDAGIERYGLDLSVFRTFARRLRLTLGLGYERVESGNRFVTNDPGGDAYVAASLGVRYDGGDGRRFPWSGVVLEALGREVGPGTDEYSIHEGHAAAAAYAPLAGRAVLALGGSLDYRSGDRIPAYRREHLGGSGTLRGHGFGTFHGIRSVISSVEFRVPLNFSRARPAEDLLLGISAHLFADAGAAWEDGENLDGEKFHGTFGVGVIILNGSVPGLRIDYGWHRHSSGRLEVDVGMKF